MWYKPYARQIVEALNLPRLNVRLTTRDTMAFGNKGSLRVKVGGPKAGLYYNFERRLGGTFFRTLHGKS